MAARHYIEADLDFGGIESDLARLLPPRLSLAEVLERLDGKLRAGQARGVTVAQLRGVLNAHGIEVSERGLRAHLDRGEGAERPAEPALAKAPAEDGSGGAVDEAPGGAAREAG